MTSSHVDVASLPSEIICKIIGTFLPLQDVLNCMFACNSWKVSNIKVPLDLKATLPFLYMCR